MYSRILFGAIFICLAGCASAPAIGSAARAGNLEEVRALLDEGADPNAKGGLSGMTPLNSAAVSGHENVVQLLIDRGADVNQPYYFSTGATSSLFGSPVLAAAFSGDIATIDVLLKNGANLRDRLPDKSHSMEGASALHVAASADRVPMVKHLLSLGVDVSQRMDDVNGAIRFDPLSGTDALGIAVFNNNLEIVQLLLDAGASVNPRYYSERTPIMLAAVYDRTDIVSALLEHGADTNFIDDDGQTAFGLAAYKGNVGPQELLVAYGADANAEQANPGIRAFVQHFAADYLAPSDPLRSIELYKAAAESYVLGIEHYKKEARWDSIVDASATTIANTASIVISEQRASQQANALADIASLQSNPPASITYYYTIPVLGAAQWTNAGKELLARCTLGKDRVDLLLGCLDESGSNLHECMLQATETDTEHVL